MCMQTKLMHTPAGDIIKKIENRTTTQSQPTSNPKTPVPDSPLPKAKANFTNSNFPVPVFKTEWLYWCQQLI